MFQKIKKNKAAQQLSRLRWEGLSPEERRKTTVKAVEAMRQARLKKKSAMIADESY